MFVILSLLVDLIRLPFRGLGWVCLALAGQTQGDIQKLNHVVYMLDNDRIVTKSKLKRK